MLKIKTIAVLSLISLNALAYQGQGFKIISEKHTQSPGFNGSFISKPATTMTAEALAWAHDASGRPHEYIKIQGDHNINLYNNSTTTKRYTYTYTISCENAYENFERTLDLYAKGSFTDSSHSYGTVQKDSEGGYRINVGTKINGSESAWHEAHSVCRVRR